ncbi:MAG: hypothetical protein JNN05_07000, partial [Candidatus Omnitrophica bacterium]|nr:hypothetical protein [Candidatus Omnitrophota bacterium]
KIYIDKRQPDAFWIASSHFLYRVNPHQAPQQSLNKQVFDLKQNPSSPQEFYVVTADGVEVLGPNGHWSNAFIHRGCRALAFAQGKVFVATDEGMLSRALDSGRWNSLSGKLGKQSVVRMASYGSVVYAVTPNALYRYDAATDDYKEIFSAGASREQEAADLPVDAEQAPLIHEIIDVDVPDVGEIYLSTRHGIFHTQNDGLNWEPLSNNGLSVSSLESLEIDPQVRWLWAATQEGVFHLQGDRWVKHYRGLPTNNIFDAALDDAGRIYVATNRGFYVYSPQTESRFKNTESPSKVFAKYQDVEKHFENEPTIKDVQAMAIEYADVHPDKIKRWQRQSRLKAWVPSLSTGLDRSSTELLHWDTGGNPDVLTKGRDLLDWDVGLSWHLSDLVWSSDQTSIDSRSKLMTELREEVLDQVTRIYFERRRAQLALLSDDYENDMIEEEMRLAELTAVLDGYTGGKFSRKMDQIKQN